MSSTPLEQPASSFASPRGQCIQAGLIALAGLLLLIGCWSAPFTTYDDTMHISRNAELFQNNPIEFFRTNAVETHFPITKLSYWLDRVIFLDWLHLANWATGVRLMTCLYHIGAALVVWRIALLLGLRPAQSLFVAVLFAAHPLACETVCWASERKNALAGLFGFAALWAWLRWSHSLWRLLPATVFYALACLSKPSALGILPLLVVVDLFRGRAGLVFAASLKRPGREWLRSALALAPVLAITAYCIRVNVAGHAATLVEPPGGSVCTAILTDLEILARYLGNLFAPANLSAVYLVEPVVSLSDPRVVTYGLLLAAVVALSVWLSPQRRRAVFAWLWFFGALGPSLNLIAIPHFMQDRYIYLSTPAFAIVLCDTLDGLCARLPAAFGRTLPVTATAYLVALAALGVGRSFVFESSYTIFDDAVRKQPAAAFARWGRGEALLEAAEHLEKRDPAKSRQYSRDAIADWKAAVDSCPDVQRFTTIAVMARFVGNEYNRNGDAAAAERYWLIAADSPMGQADARAQAANALAALYLTQGSPDRAYQRAGLAVLLSDEPVHRLARAKAALALARRTQGAAARALPQQAREDLHAIPPQSPLHARAKELLNDPLLQRPFVFP
jgi:hypothetical protein